MELVKLEVSVPKELNDVRLFVVELLKDIKAGKDRGAILAENMPNLFVAVEGVSTMSEEVKQESAKSAVLAGLMGGEIIGVFL